MLKPERRAREVGDSAAARFAGSVHIFYMILGLAPQALYCRPLRGLRAQTSEIYFATSVCDGRSVNKVQHFPCSSCGADLVYEPGDGFLTCPYCGHKEAIPESAARVEEQMFEQHLRIRPEQMAQLAIDALEVQCQSCGAKSIFTPPEVAGRCEFCGVQIVAQPKSADPILTPGGVLPFRITQPQASSELRRWLSSRWFAPSSLKHFAQPDAIHGVYIPFWTYDTSTTTDYTGQRGEYYYITETYTERDAQGRKFNARDR